MDPDSQIFRKGMGKSAKLNYMGYVLTTENCNRLIVEVTIAEAAKRLRSGRPSCRYWRNCLNEVVERSVPTRVTTSANSSMTAGIWGSHGMWPRRQNTVD